MTRRGFTLLELIVALALTGIVALLIYGAASAASDVEARLAANRRAAQAQVGMRTLLEDALRNARPAPRPGDPVFRLETRTSTRGVPNDQLTFVTRGGFPPLTGDADWRVTIEATPHGLAARAVPLGVRAPARVAALLPGVTGLEIRVQPVGGGPWSRTWAMPGVFPRAVLLTLWNDSGPVALPPLRVRLPLGGAT